MIWTLPNILTVARIALTPVIALLPFIQGATPKLVSFAVFLVAAFSDILDGRLARRRKEVTDLGKMLDPLADKLLLLATLIPIYWITSYRAREYAIPWWGNVPVWVLVILLGREALMTGLRSYAKRRGVVIAAQRAGKLKTVIQDIFIGSTIAWFAWKDLAARYGWRRGWLGALWERIHGTLVAGTLAVALVVTVYSLVLYLYRYRKLFQTDVAAHPDGH